MQLRAVKAQVWMRTNIPDDLPSLKADERRFRQILPNLFSPGGMVTVTARVDDTGSMRLTVVPISATA